MSEEEEKEKQWRTEGARNGKLWGVEHPYYCSETNYYASRDNSPNVWPSWEAFAAEFDGDTDLDMNLVFRWDWEPTLPDWNGNESETLRVFMMHQRKGRFICHRIENMRPEDEPGVRVYLARCWAKLQELWRPLS